MAKIKEVLVRIKQYFTKEAQDRASGDSALNTKIEAETTRATGVESGLNTRVGNIESDYLKASDKTELNNAIQLRALTTETGNKIDLEIDNTTFKIKAKLYDKNNTLISTSNEIDLPLESVVVGGSYDSVNKKVVLTLQNGTTIEFSVADLIYGLQSEITAQNPLSSDLVDDTNNTHKFVSANEKAQITTNQNDIAGIKNGENLDSFADVEDELEAKADKSTTYTKTDVDNLLDDKADKTEIPTKTSDLENDSGFLTQHQDISGKEDKSNKVSAFQTTPDNTHYPTEKLVKDSLDDKQDTINDLQQIRAGATAGATAVQDNAYVHTDNNYTTAEKNKLSGIESGAEVNDVNSVNGKTGAVVLDSDDISDTNNTHKFVSEAEKSTWNGKQDAINDLAAIRSGASAGATAVQDSNYVHTDNNYTNAEKQKLANLENYDDTAVRGLITTEANRATIQENKSLYFTGAFDSADGKTRQTGYETPQSLIDKTWTLEGAGSTSGYKFWCYIPSAYATQSDRLQLVINSSALEVRGDIDTAGGIRLAEPSGSYSQTRLFINVSNDVNTVDKLKAWILQNNFTIQYKLATPYTDTGIIEGETILPLDSNMANKIRQKVVDGLNVWNLEQEFIVSGNSSPSKNDSELIELEAGTYTIVFTKTRISGVAISNNTLYDIDIRDYDNNILYYTGTTQLLPSGSHTFTITFNVTRKGNVGFWFQNKNGDINYNTKVSDIMLVEANHPYPYSDFNQKEHITNDEATLLKQEWEKGLNVCYKFEVSNYRLYVYANLKPNTSYSFSCLPSTQVPNLWIKDLSGNTLQTVWSSDYSKNTSGYTFTTNSSVNGNVLIENGVNIQTITPSNIMLNEGSHAYPYQEYNGAIIHEKDLPKQAYLHHITFYGTIESTGTFIVHFDIKSDSAEAFTMSSIATYLDSIVHYTGNKAIACSGYFSNGANGLKYPIVSVKGYSNSDIYITVVQYSSGILLTYNCNGTIADVIE